MRPGPRSLAADIRINPPGLPPGSGPKVVVAGHTHAARALHLMDERVYLNTGTWMPLMLPPPLEDAAAVEAWLNDLAAGNAPLEHRLRYAEITTAGARLVAWEEAPGALATLSTGEAEDAGPQLAGVTSAPASDALRWRERVTPSQGPWQARAGMRALLARLIWEPAELRLVAWDAGLKPEAICWQGTAEQVWESILDRVEGEPEAGQRLVTVVKERYYGNAAVGVQREVTLAEWLGMGGVWTRPE